MTCTISLIIIARVRTADIEDLGHFRQLNNGFSKLLEISSGILEQWDQYFKEISAVEFDHSSVPSGLSMYGPVNKEGAAIKKMKDSRLSAQTTSQPILKNMGACQKHLADWADKSGLKTAPLTASLVNTSTTVTSV